MHEINIKVNFLFGLELWRLAVIIQAYDISILKWREDSGDRIIRNSTNFILTVLLNQKLLSAGRLKEEVPVEKDTLFLRENNFQNSPGICVLCFLCFKYPACLLFEPTWIG